VLAGTWKSGDYRGGLKEGMVKMSKLNAVVPAEAAKLFEEKKAALTAGTFNPFSGPIKDQTGAVKYAAGVAVPLKDLLSMNFYVQGVEGTIPK
jgi:basic membrane protein A